MTEPPVFMHLSNEDLQRAVDDPEAVLKLLKYPQHTQSTELMVQKMANASSYFFILQFTEREAQPSTLSPTRFPSNDTSY